MIDFKTKFSLKQYNTFGIDVSSEYFTEVSSSNDIYELVDSDIFKAYPRLILGGGSNILFTRSFEGLIIHPQIKELDLIDENETYVFLKAGSGAVWDELVEYSVSKGWGGLENLSAIPGRVGASPIQNIGAYGVEARDVIFEVHGIDLAKGKTAVFKNSECEFDYRSSIFKHKLKNDFLITHVVFQLKKSPHKLITDYGQIGQSLNKEKDKTISAMRKIICEMRSSKLPDVATTGNAGSFFKNPVVTKVIAEKLKLKFNEIPQYQTPEGSFKLSAAWLIEKSGCKGIQIGNAGTYQNQPLVLINLGNAKGEDIIRLAEYIKNKVYKMFEVNLEEEVNVI